VALSFLVFQTQILDVLIIYPYFTIIKSDFLAKMKGRYWIEVATLWPKGRAEGG
jgi:hypothetical protein